MKPTSMPGSFARPAVLALAGLALPLSAQDGSHVLVPGGTDFGSWGQREKPAPLEFGLPGRIVDFEGNASYCVADMDLDGVLDLVGISDGELAVRRGRGDGTYRKPETYAFGAELVAPRVADVNGDSLPDVVVGDSYWDGEVHLLLGVGGGLLGPVQSFEPGHEVHDLALADLNADGILDLVLAAGYTKIYLGRPNGTFLPLTEYWFNDHANDVAIADLDGDGAPDLVVGVGGYSGNPTGETIAVAMGAGDGTFVLGEEWFVTVVLDVEAGDLTGDGIPDIAGSTYEEEGFYLLEGLGGGAFAPPVVIDLGTTTEGLALGDVDGDGSLEAILLGDDKAIVVDQAPGGFGAVTSVSACAADSAVSFGDCNGDGSVDLVCSGWSVSVLLADGEGAFGGVASDVEQPSRIRIADLDGDGVPDLVAHNGEPQTISVHLGLGDGSFGGAVHTASVAPYPVLDMKLADVDGNGAPDLFLHWGPWGVNDLVLFLGNGDGTFGPMENVPISSGVGGAAAFNTSAIADCDGDGHLDVGLVYRFGQMGEVLLGNGDGTFQPGLSFPTPFDTVSMSLSDFDSDDVPDLLFLDRDADTVVVRLGLGDGTFGADVVTPVGANTPLSFAVGDFDGDDRLDLAIRSLQVDARVLLGNGDGSFQPAAWEVVDNHISTYWAADMDLDGFDDYVQTKTYQSRAVAVYLSRGDGTFRAPVEYALRKNDSDFRLADVDLDGDPDVVTCNASNGSIQFLPNLTVD